MALTFKTVRIDYLSYESLSLDNFEYSNCTIDYAVANHQKYKYGRIITVTATDPTDPLCQICFEKVLPAADPTVTPMCDRCRQALSENIPVADPEDPEKLLKDWIDLQTGERFDLN